MKSNYSSLRLTALLLVTVLAALCFASCSSSSARSMPLSKLESSVFTSGETFTVTEGGSGCTFEGKDSSGQYKVNGSADQNKNVKNFTVTFEGLDDTYVLKSSDELSAILVKDAGRLTRKDLALMSCFSVFGNLYKLAGGNVNSSAKDVIDTFVNLNKSGSLTVGDWQFTSEVTSSGMKLAVK